MLPPIESRLTLFQAQRAKKEAEQEVQALKNRIAMLKNEHEKTIKVVQKTERKAFDVYKAKVRQEEKKKQRKERQMQLEQIKGTTYPLYQDQRERVHKSKVENIMQKRIEANELKRQLNQENQIKLQDDYFDYKYKREKALQIKQEELMNLESVRNKREELQRSVRHDVEQQIVRSMREKEEHEKLLRELDEQENELVQKLQNSQDWQRNSIDMYKTAKSVSAEEFEKKFPVEKYSSTQSSHSLRVTKYGQASLQFETVILVINKFEQKQEQQQQKIQQKEQQNEQQNDQQEQQGQQEQQEQKLEEIKEEDGDQKKEQDEQQKEQGQEDQ